MSVRFTAAQLATLVKSGEIVYWSDDQQDWIIHSMDLVWRDQVISEAQEAWHLRRVIEEYLGQEVKLVRPGTYLQRQERWRPYFIIEQERVVVGLEWGVTKEKRERVLGERNVTLRAREEVQSILSQGMVELLEEQGITPERRLQSEIRNEIEFILEEVMKSEEQLKLTYSGVMIRTDEVGGERVYIYFKTDSGEEHAFPVTDHLHNMFQFSPISVETIRELVEQELNDLPITHDCVDTCVREVIGLLRQQHLLSE
jgi:hypothetical protein